MTVVCGVSVTTTIVVEPIKLQYPEYFVTKCVVYAMNNTITMATKFGVVGKQLILSE